MFPATTGLYTLSLHDALPISPGRVDGQVHALVRVEPAEEEHHRSEEHTSELQSQSKLVCRLLLEKKTPTEEDPDRSASRYRNYDIIIMSGGHAGLNATANTAA